MNIVITGASRGIGFETALQLCKDGHQVIAVARSGRGLEKLQAAVSASGAGTKLMVQQADLTSEKDIQELAHTAKKLGGSVDVLINNAGALVNKPFAEIPLTDLRQVYEVNVFAPFRLVQVFLPLLGQNKTSHIVNIGSMGGVQGTSKFAGLSVYSSSKGAVSILTECLAEELKEKNIRVNCLALGAAQTEMLDEAFPGYRAPLSAAEMAKWIAWFAVNGHQYFNGKILPVAVSTP